MAAVHFYLKPSEKSELHIVLSFIYEKRGKPFRFYTKLFCPKENWDTETERVIPPQKNRIDTNSMLNKLYDRASKVNFRFEEEGKRLTDEVLKKELTAIRYGGRVENSRQTFLQFFEDLVERKKRTSNNKNTPKKYITTLNHVKEFVQSQKKKFDFEDINKRLLDDFIEYLYNNKKKIDGFQPNHVQKLASTLKTVLRRAEEEEVHPNFKLKDSWLKVPKVETDAIYLTHEEVKAIENFDLSTNLRLDRVRDLFLIGIHTGLRYCDYKNLSEVNFPVLADGTRNIELRAKKTGGVINYPLFPDAEMVLRKYDFNPPLGISDTNMNLYLKELGKLVGLNQTFKFSKYINNRRVDGTCPKWEKISTHTARRTFATNAMAGGVPVELIMHMTGHKNLKDLFKYIRFTDEEKSDRIRNHDYFKKSIKVNALGLKDSENEFF